MSTYAPRTSPSVFSTPASTTLFRCLTWEGTVPLEVRADPKELRANSDRGVERYYIHAPRVSCLALLVPESRRFLMDAVLDVTAARVIKEEDWWFESEEGSLLKWCVPDPSSGSKCALGPARPTNASQHRFLAQHTTSSWAATLRTISILDAASSPGGPPGRPLSCHALSHLFTVARSLPSFPIARWSKV